MKGANMNLPTKLSECIDVDTWEKTEEGASWFSIEYDIDGDSITAYVVDGGRDCDGILEHEKRFRGTIHGDTVEWDREGTDTMVYDQYAVAAGY
jgi:hypothetical protein